MEVYLLRHGAADSAHGTSDAERTLTADGEYDVRKVVSAAKLAGCTPALIVASPLRRARQSAEIAAEVFGHKGAIASSAALAPDSSPESLWDEVRAGRDEGCVLLVGHNPLFANAAAYLLGAPALALDFPSAGLMRIDVERFDAQPGGVLRYFIVPKLCV